MAQRIADPSKRSRAGHAKQAGVVFSGKRAARGANDASEGGSAPVVAALLDAQAEGQALSGEVRGDAANAERQCATGDAAWQKRGRAAGGKAERQAADAADRPAISGPLSDRPRVGEAGLNAGVQTAGRRPADRARSTRRDDKATETPTSCGERSAKRQPRKSASRGTDANGSPESGGSTLMRRGEQIIARAANDRAGNGANTSGNKICRSSARVRSIGRAVEDVAIDVGIAGSEPDGIFADKAAKFGAEPAGPVVV
jgi:hypothetical protein